MDNADFERKARLRADNTRGWRRGYADGVNATNSDIAQLVAKNNWLENERRIAEQQRGEDANQIRALTAENARLREQLAARRVRWREAVQLALEIIEDDINESQENRDYFEETTPGEWEVQCVAARAALLALIDDPDEGGRKGGE